MSNLNDVAQIHAACEGYGCDDCGDTGWITSESNQAPTQRPITQVSVKELYLACRKSGKVRAAKGIVHAFQRHADGKLNTQYGRRGAILRYFRKVLLNELPYTEVACNISENNTVLEWICTRENGRQVIVTFHDR